jgi:hypothetical protein
LRYLRASVPCSSTSGRFNAKSSRRTKRCSFGFNSSETPTNIENRCHSLKQTDHLRRRRRVQHTSRAKETGIWRIGPGDCCGGLQSCQAMSCHYGSDDALCWASIPSPNTASPLQEAWSRTNPCQPMPIHACWLSTVPPRPLPSNTKYVAFPNTQIASRMSCPKQKRGRHNPYPAA